MQEIPEDGTIGEAVDAASTPSFFSDLRVIVVRNAGRFRADEIEPLLSYISSPSPTSVLVMVGGGGALPQRLSKAIKAHGHIEDVSAPTGKARATWIKEQLSKGPVTLDRNAAALFADHIGDDVSSIPGVLDALGAAYGEGAKIDVDQLTPFLGAGGSATPWELTDAIDSGDTPGALNALHKLLGPGQRHPLVVLATLSKHVGSLLKLDGRDVTSEAEAAKLLGMAPFPAKKAMNQARRLGSDKIKRALLLVSQAELDLKGASAWPGEMVLEVLIARLSKLVPGATNRHARRSG